MHKRKYTTQRHDYPSKRAKMITATDRCWISYNSSSRSSSNGKISKSWIREGKSSSSTTTLGTEFCQPHLPNCLLESKSALDGIDSRIIDDARRRLDPCGKIGRGIFLNRSAVKLANLDYLYRFTADVAKQRDRLLYFADVCAGPGGFSDYLLYKLGWKCKGFGFTLKKARYDDDNDKDDDDDLTDLQVDRFLAPETFVPHYGAPPAEDGNIYDLENLRSFRDFVMGQTDDSGVDLVLCDGGFSVENRENLQEILSRRLYLCQFLCSLMILRPSGHFVCKLFDVFTNFSVGLVYLMYRAFEKISICKPDMSRPSNSERYVVCKYRREDTSDICDLLSEINENFDNVEEIVPLSILKSDRQFFEYVYRSNNAIAKHQILSLEMMQSCIRNPRLYEPEQNRTRDRYLKLWDVPRRDKRRINRMIVTKLDDNEKGDESSCLFLSLGRSNIYRLDPKKMSHEKMDVNLELPAQTLFWGKLTKDSLHLTDALYLGGIDIQNLSYRDRLKQCKMLAKAVSKPNHVPLVVIEKRMNF